MGNRRYVKIIVLLIFMMAFGFAYLTSNLKINGATVLKGNTWDVYFANIVKESADSGSVVIDEDKTTVRFNVNLDNPGSESVFYVDVINDGSLDAMLDTLEVGGISEKLEKYLAVDVTYSDGIDVEKNDILEANTRDTLKVRCYYSQELDIEDLPETDLLSNLSLNVQYVQADDNGKYRVLQVWNFDYLGREKEFKVPSDGIYKLEVWGAQGGSNYSTGGYGAYSVGQVSLSSGTVLYIHTGGQPTTETGGYNGGGDGNFAGSYNVYYSAGGGATHIATKSGLLSSLSESKSNVLIIAGGGGGSAKYHRDLSGGSAGGAAAGKVYYNNSKETNITLSGNSGATQTYSGKVVDSGWIYPIIIEESGGFGYGADCAGGGYYGGAHYTTGNRVYSGAGGSGYIGNQDLTDKVMYCYNCEEPDSNDENYDNIKTISTINVSENAVSQYAKIGNGYAKITFLGES